MFCGAVKEAKHREFSGSRVIFIFLWVERLLDYDFKILIASHPAFSYRNCSKLRRQSGRDQLSDAVIIST